MNGNGAPELYVRRAPTVKIFYARLRTQRPARFEYWDGDIICMSGGGGSHGMTWERRDVTDMEASLDLESVGCPLKMRDIYDGLTFPA